MHILGKIIFTCGLVYMYVFHMIILQQLDQGWLFGLDCPPGISSLPLNISFKSSAIEISHPISTFDNLLLCGYGFVLDLHIHVSRAWKKCCPAIQDK